jgi:hypothetical protein
VPFKPLALLFGLLAPLLEKLQHIRGKDDRFAGIKDLLQALLAKRTTTWRIRSRWKR